jgi:hypothetical protein
MRHLVLLAALAASAALAEPAREHLLGAPAHSTDAGAGADLVRLVAEPAGVPLAAAGSAGAVENVRRLAAEPGARLAFVQSDVWGALVEQAHAGNATAQPLVERLRVFMPLFDEELHFVVRADSPLHYVHEIAGRRLNVGPMGGGAAFTAARLYARMFGREMPAADASFLPDDEALARLARDHSIDVAVVVGGQPAPLFAELSPQARQSIRLLAVDPTAAPMRALAGAYAETTIRQRSYPGWLAQDVPALAVGTLLMTRDYQTPAIRGQLAGLAHALCIDFAQLRAEGHPKWKEASFAAPALPAGWRYYEPSREVLADCPAEREADAQSWNRKQLQVHATTCAGPGCGRGRP